MGYFKHKINAFILLCCNTESEMEINFCEHKSGLSVRKLKYIYIYPGGEMKFLFWHKTKVITDIFVTFPWRLLKHYSRLI